MFSRSSVALFVLASSIAGACRERKPATLTDSEGRTFSMDCETPDSCAIEQKSGPRGGASGRPTVSARGRFYGICDGAAGTTWADCRVLVCSTDAECPPIPGSNQGVCVGSLCVDPSHAMTSDDAVLLCMAGTGLGHGSPLQAERYALGLNCGAPCRIPKPCRQP